MQVVLTVRAKSPQSWRDSAAALWYYLEEAAIVRGDHLIEWIKDEKAERRKKGVPEYRPTQPPADDAAFGVVGFSVPVEEHDADRSIDILCKTALDETGMGWSYKYKDRRSKEPPPVPVSQPVASSVSGARRHAGIGIHVSSNPAVGNRNIED